MRSSVDVRALDDGLPVLRELDVALVAGRFADVLRVIYMGKETSDCDLSSGRIEMVGAREGEGSKAKGPHPLLVFSFAVVG